MDIVDQSAPDARYQRLPDSFSQTAPLGLVHVDRLMKRLDLLFLDVEIDLATGQIPLKSVLEMLRLMQLRVDQVKTNLTSPPGQPSLRPNVS